MGRGSGQGTHLASAALTLRRRSRSSNAPTWLPSPVQGAAAPAPPVPAARPAPAPARSQDPVEQFTRRFAGASPWTLSWDLRKMNAVLDGLSQIGDDERVDTIATSAALALNARAAGDHQGLVDDVHRKLTGEPIPTHLRIADSSEQLARTAIESCRGGDRDAPDRFLAQTGPRYRQMLNDRAVSALAEAAAATPREAVSTLCGEEAADMIERLHLKRRLRPDRRWGDALDQEALRTVYGTYLTAHAEARVAETIRAIESLAGRAD